MSSTRCNIIKIENVAHFEHEQVQEDFCVGSTNVQVSGSVEDSVLEADTGELKVHSAHTRSGNSVAALSSCCVKRGRSQATGLLGGERGVSGGVSSISVTRT